MYTYNVRIYSSPSLIYFILRFIVYVLWYNTFFKYIFLNKLEIIDQMRSFQGKTHLFSYFRTISMLEKNAQVFFPSIPVRKNTTIGKICHTILGQFRSHEIWPEPTSSTTICSWITYFIYIFLRARSSVQQTDHT